MDMVKYIEQTGNRYTISENGIVYDTHLNKVVNQYTKPNGYLIVRLVLDNGKVTFPYVHRLVAIAFIQNKSNKLEVNHKDGNKKNNTRENLEWATHSENQLHRFRVLNKPAILKGTHLHGNMKTVIQKTIKGEVIAKYDSLLEASKKTGSSYSNISLCIHGKRKSCNGYTWEYGNIC